LLDKQFFGDDKFRDYLDENFIAVHAVRGKDSGDKLYKKYTVRGTPTVLVAMADGTEIDRIIGYGPPADKFKAKIEKTYKSENSLLNLTKAFKKDPNDFALVAKLAKKYQDRYDLGKTYEFTDRLLENPGKAKKITISVKKDQEVSTYEYAKFIATYRGIDEIVEFINEFPNSSFRNAALSNLGDRLDVKKVSQDVFSVYDKFLKKYPSNPFLILPYVAYSVKTKENVDKSVKLAEQIFDTNFEKNNTYALENHAKLYLIMGNMKKAEKVYGEKFIKKYENDSEISEEAKANILNGYSWFWALEGKNLKSALKAAKKSIELSDEASTWDTLSMVYWKQGKHKEAIKAEKEALDLKPGNKNYIKRIEEIKADMK